MNDNEAERRKKRGESLARRREADILRARTREAEFTAQEKRAADILRAPYVKGAVETIEKYKADIAKMATPELLAEFDQIREYDYVWDSEAQTMEVVAAEMAARLRKAITPVPAPKPVEFVILFGGRKIGLSADSPAEAERMLTTLTERHQGCPCGNKYTIAALTPVEVNE